MAYSGGTFSKLFTWSTDLWRSQQALRERLEAEFAGIATALSAPAPASLTVAGATITKILSASGTLDFPSIAAAGNQDLTIAVTGAAVGDAVILGLPASPDAGVVFDAWVSATNTVKIRATNATAGAVDPASASYRVIVVHI
jgi:hypothetical protein